MSTSIEEEVDDLILAYDQWFQDELNNAPMTGVERAIIKTFCWYLIHVHKDAMPRAPSTDEGAKK